MNENRTSPLVDTANGGEEEFIWNRLHGECEDIREVLLESHDRVSDERREWLQARLGQVEDALDRLMSGTYGNCSRCGQAIEETRLDLDPTLTLCLDCWATRSVTPTPEMPASRTVILEDLNQFDTILARTHNSDYRILLLDPKTGRALVEGGNYLVEPTEALVRGSAVAGDAFRGGAICVGCRLEIWVHQRALLTSPITSVYLKRNRAAESVEDISAALH